MTPDVSIEEPQVPDAWYETARAVDQYEDAAAEGLPDLSGLLAGVSREYRSAVLLELVQVDMEYRWKRGEAKTADAYLREYPQLGEQSDSVRALLNSELERIRSSGDGRLLDDFRRRHPDVEIGEDRDERISTTIVVAESTILGRFSPAQPQRIGKYCVRRKLGEGAFGVVYGCWDPDLNRDVAVKIARQPIERLPGGTEGLRHEATAAAQIRHPNAVAVLDFAIAEDGRPYIVYEYVAGEPLGQRIAGQDYTLEQAVRWAAEVADALHAAHKKQVIHRDVKPANVLIHEDGTAHLTDFGLARREDRFFADDADVLIGTAQYMSPEQATGKSDLVTAASDVFSLGAVLYELLCQRPAFRGATRSELARQVIHRAPDPPRTINEQIPPPIETACLKALAKNPEDRFRTAGDMARTLRAAIQPKPSRLPLFLGFAAAAAALVLWPLLVPRTTPTPPETLRVLTPLLDVQRPGNRLLYRLPEVQPQTGDRLEVKAESTRDSYLWVVLYADSGNARLLFPAAESRGPKERLTVARCPSPANDFLVMPDRDGVMLVLVGATERPLSADQLEKLLAVKPDFPAPLRHDKLEAIAFPRLGVDVPAYVTLRGGSVPDQGGQNLYRFPPTFQSDVHPFFQAYYAVMFSHFRRNLGNHAVDHVQ